MTPVLSLIQMDIQKNGPTRFYTVLGFSSSVLQGSYLPKLCHLYISKYSLTIQVFKQGNVKSKNYGPTRFYIVLGLSSSVLQGSKDGRAVQLQAVQSNIVCETWWPPPSFVNVYLLLLQAKAPSPAPATACTPTAEARHCSKQQQCRRAGRLRRPPRR